MPSFRDFLASTLQQADYSGRTYWGAFVGNQLAAYAATLEVDGAVTLGETKAAQALLRHNPNNALFYTLTRHYLAEPDIRYVTNGMRTLWHPTTINEFLERMGFRKVYCRLHLELGPIARAFQRSRALPVMGRVAAKLDRRRPNPLLGQIAGFSELLNIAERTRM